MLEVNENYYKSRRLSTLRLWGRILDEMQLEDQLVWSVNTLEMREDCRADSSDGDGIVNLLATVREDLFPQEVYVFTPAGDVRALPQGATPVDFAYNIHTEVGHRCTGAKVNGAIVPLKYKLQNGDTVEVLTSKHHAPSRDWLNFVATPKARHRIRQWFKVEERARLFKRCNIDSIDVRTGEPFIEPLDRFFKARKARL